MVLALVLHSLAAAVWVGGMFFAYMALRPAAGALEPPQRLTLWRGTFDRFFPGSGRRWRPCWSAAMP